MLLYLFEIAQSYHGMNQQLVYHTFIQDPLAAPQWVAVGDCGDGLAGQRPSVSDLTRRLHWVDMRVAYY